MTRPTPPIADCPKCGEARSIDVILTGNEWSFYCSVCSHAWTHTPETRGSLGVRLALDARDFPPGPLRIRLRG